MLVVVTPVLAASGDERIIAALLQNENFKVRLKAAQQLGVVRSPQAVEALITGLGDPHPLVRAASANSLGLQGDRAAVRPLCELSRDADEFVRTTVAESLAVFGGPSACAPRKVFLALNVTADEPAHQEQVQRGLLAKAALDGRLVIGRELNLESGQLGTDPQAEASAGRMPGVELKIRAAVRISRQPSQVVVSCELAQSVYDFRLKALRGSATQRADIELGTTSVTDAALQEQVFACLDALIPVVYDGFSAYLERLK